MLPAAYLPRWNRQAPLLTFAREWLAVAALIVFDVLLAAHANLHFFITWKDAVIAAPVLLGMGIAAQGFGARRLGFMLEFVALVMVAGTALAALTYISSALSGPWMDSTLRAADRMLGFDWWSWFLFVTGHKMLATVLQFLYFSLGYQVIYFVVIMVLKGDDIRLRETFWVLSIGCLITCIGAWAALALGPYDTYHLKQTYGAFVLELERLKHMHSGNFDLGILQGVVDFPSFHSTMALSLAYGMRRTGIIGWGIALANLLLLFAVPVYGGHYLADVVAGILVFLVAVAMVRLMPGLRQGSTMPAVFAHGPVASVPSPGAQSARI